MDGHPAWSIRAEVGSTPRTSERKGDTVEVIVVDTGSPESLAMFAGAVSLGDDDLLKTMNATIKNLRVE